MSKYNQHKILFKIIKWKERKLSKPQFVIILSALIGLAVSLITVFLKNMAYLLQYLIEKGLLFTFEQIYYFIFSIIGLLMTYVLLNYIKDYLSSVNLQNFNN